MGVGKWLRRGLGEALVRWCEDLAVEWGHQALFLHVERANESAIRFYRRQGYTQVPNDLAWWVIHQGWGRGRRVCVGGGGASMVAGFTRWSSWRQRWMEG